MTDIIVTDIYGHEHTLPGPYTTIAEIKRANKALGRFYFEPDTMRFFDSQIESGVIRGRVFVTSEQFHGSRPENDGPRQFTVRVCGDDGDCETLIDAKFEDLFDAAEAIDNLITDSEDA